MYNSGVNVVRKDWYLLRGQTESNKVDMGGQDFHDYEQIYHTTGNSEMLKFSY